MPGLRPWGWRKGIPKRPFSPDQENPAKLSDQQEAISQGQNPYPIYASINVRTNISGEDFAGVWVCRWRQRQVGGWEAPGLSGDRWEPRSIMGLLPPALGKAKIPAQATKLESRGEGDPQGPGGEPLVTFPLLWAPRVVRVHPP